MWRDRESNSEARGWLSQKSCQDFTRPAAPMLFTTAIQKTTTTRQKANVIYIFTLIESKSPILGINATAI